MAADVVVVAAPAPAPAPAPVAPAAVREVPGREEGEEERLLNKTTEKTLCLVRLVSPEQYHISLCKFRRRKMLLQIAASEKTM